MVDRNQRGPIHLLGKEEGSILVYKESEGRKRKVLGEGANPPLQGGGVGDYEDSGPSLAQAEIT